MSRIEKLIEELCPEGVEYKELGEVAEISAGNSAPQNLDLFIKGKYPFCRTADLGKVHHSRYFNTIQDHLNKEGIRGLKLYKKETILFPKSGASTLLNHRVLLSIDAYVSSHLATIYRNEEFVLASYLYHFLLMFDARSLVADVSYPSLKLSEISKISIPIPPLPIQQEIVTILDTFTALDAELQAELEARRKQYEHYRNELLNFEGKNIQRLKLFEVAQVINGRAYSQPELLSEGKYPVLRVGNFFTNNSWYYSNLELEENKYCDNGDLLYAWSASFGPKLWNGNKVIYHYHIWKIDCSKIIDKKYLYYWLQSEDMAIQAFSIKHGATMAHLTKEKMEKLMVPIPPLAEQERIVGILDKFDALCSVELPAEIAARRKQYEYYREKLLTF